MRQYAWSAIGGAPGPTRTGGLRIRSPTLYPTELRVRAGGVSEGIRTPGRWSHNPELYQLSYAHHKSCRPANDSIFPPTLTQKISAQLRRKMIEPPGAAWLLLPVSSVSFMCYRMVRFTRGGGEVSIGGSPLPAID